MMNLNDAITGVENASTVYSTSVTQTTNDQAAAAAIQAKLDSANATVASDVEAQSTAAAGFNSALDALIAAATAAKIA